MGNTKIGILPHHHQLAKKIKLRISTNQELFENAARQRSVVRMRLEEQKIIYLRDTDQEAALTQGAENPHKRLGEIFQQDNIQAHKSKSQCRQELHYTHMLRLLKERCQHKCKENLRAD